MKTEFWKLTQFNEHSQDILLTILILFSTFSYSQSRLDTQEWVKTIFEQYTDNKYHVHKIKFSSDGKIMTVENPFLGVETYYEDIVLKDINQIIVKENSEGTANYITFVLICKDNKATIKSGKYKNGEKIIMEVVSQYAYRFPITLKEQDLTTRLKKALTHLIVLQGGKVISDTF